MAQPRHQPSEAAIKVAVDGETYYLDLGRISIQQGIVIHGRMGMSVEALMERFGELMGQEGDGDARADEEKQAAEQEMLKILHCFWWLMRAQAGIREPIAESDGPLFPFLTALLEGMSGAGLTAQDGGGAQAEPDPTPPPSPPTGPPSPGPPTRRAADRKPGTTRERAAAAASPGTG